MPATIRFLISVSIALSISPTAYCAMDAALETFEYALRISGGKAALKKQMLAVPVRDEQSRSALLSAAESYSTEEVSKRAAGLVSRTLTIAEASSCVKFARSQAGEFLAKALESAVDQRATEKALGEVPTQYRKPVGQFLASSCYRKAVEVSASPEFIQIQNAYGSELMCAQYKQQSPSAFSSAVDRGICRQ
jgi:hypothetical protein